MNLSKDGRDWKTAEMRFRLKPREEEAEYEEEMDEEAFPACGLDCDGALGVVRWFPLHRYAVSLRHRLISLLPAGSQCRTDLPDVKRADPAHRLSLYYVSLIKHWRGAR